jgi:CHAT domain-containing protein/tetratricopeptide (TPR) repeat protein
MECALLVNTRVIRLADVVTADGRSLCLSAASAALLVLAAALPAHAQIAGCAEVLERTSKVLERHWVQQGSTTARIDLPPADGRDWLVRISEHGIDVEVDFQDEHGVVMTRTDSPVERRASQHVFVPASGPYPTVAVVTAKEPAQVQGAVSLYISALPGRSAAQSKELGDCAEALKNWADADTAYAAGREISLARSATSGASARAMFNSAAEKYQAALDGVAGPSHVRDQGELQISMAAVSYYELQDWAGSASWAEKAAATFRRAGDIYKRHRAQAILTAAWLEIATKSASPRQATATPRESRKRLDQARNLLSTLANLHEHRHETYEATLQINNIGLAFFYEARFELAIPYFSRAKAAFERLGENSREAVALQNRALCEWGLGHLSAALPKFDQALSLMRPTLYPDLYLLTLNNSGLAHYAAGQFDAALQLQTEALDFATRSQADRSRARSNYGIGMTYYAIGDRELATRFLHSALDLSPAELDARTRIVTLRALAVIERETGLLPDAITHNEAALSLATGPTVRARIILQLAWDYEGHGEAARAIQLLNELISRPPSGDPLARGMALAERGAILRATAHLGAAEHDLLGGLRILIQYDALAERFEAEVELARLRLDQHRTKDAFAGIHRALEMSREIRAQTANPEYRASIARSLRPALDFEIELLRVRYDHLVQRGELRAARMLASESLRAADDFRAQGFEDWRAERLENQKDKSVPGLLRTSAALYHDMAERRFQLAAREDRVGALDSRALALREDIGRLRVRVGVIDSEVAARTTTVSVSSRESSSTRRGSTQLNALPADSVLVEYWLGSTGAFAWVVTPNNVAWVALASGTTIDRAARDMHRDMRSGTTVSVTARLDDCDAMYRLIVAPIAQLIGSPRNLIVVPDGALHYVPFAALREGKSNRTPFLVQSFVISVAPALRFVTAGASVSAPANVASTSNRLLIIADPIYAADDARISSNASSPSLLSAVNGDASWANVGTDSSKLTRLVSTAREAAQIMHLYNAADVDILEGSDATRKTLLAKDFSTYRFIHIATHGIVDAEIPQLSALILGKYDSHGAVADPYVRADDLLARTFNAQAVVLSACDTALGKEFAGEGIIGLRYAALARGAHAVVASLWSVSDGISADLMTDMYRQMTLPTNAQNGMQVQSEPQEVAASLSAAMRHVLEQTPTLDPALWAPYTVYVAGD